MSADPVEVGPCSICRNGPEHVTEELVPHRGRVAHPMCIQGSRVPEPAPRPTSAPPGLRAAVAMVGALLVAIGLGGVHGVIVLVLVGLWVIVRAKPWVEADARARR